MSDTEEEIRSRPVKGDFVLRGFCLNSLMSMSSCFLLPSPPAAAPPPTPGLHGKVPGQLQAKNHGQANSKTPVPSAPKQRGRKPRYDCDWLVIHRKKTEGEIMGI